jgi:hypothetical protein
MKSGRTHRWLSTRLSVSDSLIPAEILTDVFPQPTARVQGRPERHHHRRELPIFSNADHVLDGVPKQWGHRRCLPQACCLGREWWRPWHRWSCCSDTRHLLDGWPGTCSQWRQPRGSVTSPHNDDSIPKAPAEAATTRSRQPFSVLELDTMVSTRCSARWSDNGIALLTPEFKLDVAASIKQHGHILRPSPWPLFVANHPSTSRSGIIELPLSATAASSRSKYLDTLQPAQLDYLVPPAEPLDICNYGQRWKFYLVQYEWS